MAEWQRKSIADGGTYSEIAEQGKAAITTVQSVLKIVQGGANVAKLFLNNSQSCFCSSVPSAAIAFLWANVTLSSRLPVGIPVYRIFFPALITVNEPSYPPSVLWLNVKLETNPTKQW